MLVQQIDIGYRQDLWLPAVAAAPSATVELDVLGRLQGTGRFDLEQHCQRCSVHVVQHGLGWLWSQGRERHLEPGDVFVFLTGDRVRYREDPRRPWRYTWFGLRGDGAMDLLGSLGFAEERVHRTAASPALWGLADECEQAFAGDRRSPYLAPAAAWRLADLLSDSRHQPAVKADPAAIMRSIIDAGYDLSLSVAAMAARLAVDRSTLFRRFRRAYGCSPQQYLQAMRLDRARGLLSRGDRTVAAVAAEVGYADHRAFARAYRRRFGHAPSCR